jgi:hypothetical protein
VLDFAAEWPIRAMQASDVIFRGAARGAYARGIAQRTAIEEAAKGTIGKAGIDARAQEIVEHLDRFPELLKEIRQGELRTVFQEQHDIYRFFPRPGEKPGLVGGAVSLVMPFTRTPLNIAAQGAELSPIGMVGAIGAARAGRTGEATDRAATALIGTAAMGVVTLMVADNVLTGDYPSDRSTPLPPGWKPWSLRIPGGPGGEDRYIPMTQLGNLGIPLELGAILRDAGEKGQRAEGFDYGAMGWQIGKLFIDQTSLRGLNQALNAVEQPDRYGEAFLEGVLGQFQPMGGLQRQLLQAQGMAARDPHGAVEALLAGNVATAQLVAPRLDELGRPAAIGPSGLGAFAPLRSGVGPQEPVLEELRTYKVPVPRVPDEVRGIRLSDAEKRQRQALLGQHIQLNVNRVMASPSYQQANPLTKQLMLQRVVSGASRQATGELLRTLDEADFAQRQAEERRRRERMLG